MALLVLTMGDRYGIGPELVAQIAADHAPGAGYDLLIVGDRRVFAHGCAVRGLAPEVAAVSDLAQARGSGRVAFLDRPFAAPVGGPGHMSPEAGREVLETFDGLVGPILRGEVDGLVYAPLNKQALKAAGHAAGDEADYFSRRLDARATEINRLGAVWTSRITSHVPISAVAGLITREAVARGIAEMAAFLNALGGPAPRLAVAALNPHAGEGGAFGREEIDVIAPAIAEAQARGIAVDGPFPADTVFPAVMTGGYDAVVTMYHDQGQIALKLLGLGQGVTVLGGLPVPVTTAGHGTAFDIAGKGVAKPDGLAAALETCARMLGRRTAAAAQ